MCYLGYLPYVSTLTYINVEKKTMKRLGKRPYNVVFFQRSVSSFQHPHIEALKWPNDVNTFIKFGCYASKLVRVSLKYTLNCFMINQFHAKVVCVSRLPTYLYVGYQLYSLITFLC